MSQRLSLRGPLLLATAVSLFLVALFYGLPIQAQRLQPRDRAGKCDSPRHHQAIAELDDNIGGIRRHGALS